MIERGAIFSASEKGVLTRKPRPVLVLQNDRANRWHSTITVCLLSSILAGNSLFRILVAPDAQNGLEQPSEVQVDRTFSLQRGSLEKRAGMLSPADMQRVSEALRRWLDL